MANARFAANQENKSALKTEAEYLRPLTQRFVVEDFKPGEQLSVTFDGLVVDPQPLTED